MPERERELAGSRDGHRRPGRRPRRKATGRGWRTALVAVTVAIVAVGSAGCGDDGGSSSAEEEPATAEGLEQGARAFAQALIDGDHAAAYQRLTARCRAERSLDEFTQQTEAALELAEAFGLDFGEAQITDVETRDVGEEGGEASVVISVPGDDDPAEPEFEPMVYEDGAWRTDDCEWFDIDGGDDVTITDGREDGGAAGS